MLYEAFSSADCDGKRQFAPNTSPKRFSIGVWSDSTGEPHNSHAQLLFSKTT